MRMNLIRRIAVTCQLKEERVEPDGSGRLGRSAEASQRRLEVEIGKLEEDINVVIPLPPLTEEEKHALGKELKRRLAEDAVERWLDVYGAALH